MYDFSIVLSNGKIISIKARSLSITETGQIKFFDAYENLIGVAPADAYVGKGKFCIADNKD